MDYKAKLFLTDKVYAHLKISIVIPTDQVNLAESLGIGEYERNNLVGQKLQELIYLLGNSEEA